MAVLQKMRDKFGVLISVLIALALLYFIAPMDDLMTLFGKPQNVGEIAGKSVSYDDFQAEVNDFTTVNEIVTGSSLKNEQQQEQIRNSAWQSLVDKYLFISNAKKAGIAVGEDEMVALTTGDMVSPIISQNYAFCDETGTFNPDALVQFVQNVDNDATGRLRTYWNYLQNTIYAQQFYQKYGALFVNSEVLNPLMLEDLVAGNNNTADIEYVAVPFGFQKDSTITVSSGEIRDYYNNHKDFYKQKASRDIEYVLYEVVPSKEDIDAVSVSFTDSYNEFASTDNVRNFLLKNSDRQYSEYWYKNGELSTISQDVNDFVANAATGTTSPIFNDGNTFYAARVLASSEIPDSVYVKHILFQGDSALYNAEKVLGQLKNNVSSFAVLAAENSADQNSAADGEIGNIGWMTQTYMIPGFQSVLTAEVGKPFILKTQYGQHIVMVSKRTGLVEKKQVAVYEKTALASKETFNSYYAEANKFATLASGNYDDYKAAVDTLGLFSHSLNKVLESTDNFGSVDNAKEVTRWIFDNKAGKVSNIITVNNNYFFVVAVKKVNKEGYAPVEDVASAIQSELFIRKQADKKLAEVKEQIAGKTTLEEIGEVLSSPVQTKTDVSFASMSQVLDYAVIGAMTKAEAGKVAEPVKGSYAIYVYKVTGRNNGSFYTEEDAKTFAAQKAQYSSQMIVPTMSDGAVVDNRARYF